MFKYRWQTIGSISIAITLILWAWKLTGAIFPDCRWLPKAQNTELNLYDWLVSSRSSGQIDERIVLVALTDADYPKYGTSPSDNLMADLILAVKKANPKLIGLGFWRTRPVGEGWEKLQKVLSTTPNLIGIEYFTNISPLIIPSKTLKEQTGDIALLLDDDKIIRRGYFYASTELFPQDFRVTPYQYKRNLAWELTYRYLSQQGVKITEPTKENPKILLAFPNGKRVTIGPLTGWEGGYKDHKGRKFTFLINWPHEKSEFKIFSFEEVLQGKAQNELQNKIVLFGPLTPIIKDLSATPYEYRKDRFGLEIYGKLLSNLLNIESEPLPQTLPEPLKYLWILIWVGIAGGGILISASVLDNKSIKRVKFLLSTFLIEGIILGILGIICYWAFPSYWIPSGIAALGIIANSATCAIVVLLQKAWDEQQKRFQEKQNYVQNLEEEIKQIKKRLIAQERTAFIGNFSRELAHHINGSLGKINADLEDLKYEWEAIKNLLEEQVNEEDYDELINRFDEIISDAKNFLQEEEGYIEKYTPIKLPQSVEELEEQEIRRIIRPVEINKLVRDCLQEIVQNRNRRNPINLNIQTNLEENLPPIEGVTAELWFVFSNLIDNAYDALLAKLEQGQEREYNPHLQVITRRQSEEILIEFADNGIGVPPYLAQKIFTFFISTKGQGRGLGLSFARDYIVGYYNGSLTLNSQDGLTKFIIRLPLTQ